MWARIAGAGLLMLAAGTAASAESVPITCEIGPNAENATVMLKNALGYQASCLASCKFSTSAYHDNPQIICAKPVPSGKEVEMCILQSSNNKLAKLVDTFAD